MIADLLIQMRHQAGIVFSQAAHTKMATITNYDPQNYRVKVLLQPALTDIDDQLSTGWLPLASIWSGNNWGLFAAPNIGDTCIVQFIDADYEAGIVTLCSFTDSARPLNVPSEEFWLVHKSGSKLKFMNDGNVEISAQNTLNVNANTVNIGNINAGNLKALLTETASTVFNTHTHPGNGSPPDQQMTAADLTTHMEAN